MTPWEKYCEVEVGYQVTVKKIGRLSVFDIKGEASSVAARVLPISLPLPVTVNTASTKEGQKLCWVSEKQWLLIAPSSQESHLLDDLVPNNPALDCRVVLVSDSYAFFSIIGKQANDVLAIASPLDIRIKKFGKNGAAYSDLFGIRALVLRRPDGYDVAVEISYAVMISACFDMVIRGRA